MGLSTIDFVLSRCCVYDVGYITSFVRGWFVDLV